MRRREEISDFLAMRAMILAQLAASGTRLQDDTRSCLLSVFLTLVNVCERVARSGADPLDEPSIAHLHMRPNLAEAMPVAGIK